MANHQSDIFYQTEALENQFVQREFSDPDIDLQQDLSFKNIATYAELWLYLINHLPESFSWDTYYIESTHQVVNEEDKLKIIYELILLGVPRIRQVRVMDNSCRLIKEVEKIFDKCYGDYSPSVADKRPFGLKTGTAWVYSDATKTKNRPHTGKVSSYDGGGFYIDLTRSKIVNREIILKLRNNLWLDRATRAIIIDFTVYNANLNLFTHTRLLAERPPSGGIMTSTTIRTVHLIHFATSYDIFIGVCQIITYLFIVYFFVKCLREIVFFKLKYFKKFWSYIDLSIIGLGSASFTTQILFLPSVAGYIAEIKANPNVYANLEYIVTVKVIINNLLAALLFMAYVKMFEYLNINKTMGQLNSTLKRCAKDILCFAVMFVIIFYAFAQLGCLLFGHRVADFRTFGISMFTLLRTILGDFNYPEIERADKYLAPIYFLGYIFFVFFILLNMFLAIINDTYADIKTELIASDQMEMTTYVKQKIIKWLRKCGCKVKALKTKTEASDETTEQIRTILSQCGFSDLEIEMFFARYNINPLAEVEEYDVEELKAEVEAQARGYGRSGDRTIVKLADFVSQQSRLERIEKEIILLSSNIENLLQQLDQVEKEFNA